MHQPIVTRFSLLQYHYCLGGAGKTETPLPQMLHFSDGTPEAQPAAGCQAEQLQASGSNPQFASGLEAHQELSCAKCRDVVSVRALKACTTAALAVQPAGLTPPKSATQGPEPAATATTAASHAANSSVVVPAAAEANAQPTAQTEADADARAEPALQSARAESAGAELPAGSQPGPVQGSNCCKRRRKKSRRVPDGCNGMPGILHNEPADAQLGPVHRTVSSKRREKEKRRLAGAFSSMLGIMLASLLMSLLMMFLSL